MNMKKCHYCGKEIHDFSSFCPYCMKSQIEKCTTIQKSRSNKKMIIIAAALILFAVSVIVISSVVKFGSKNKTDVINTSIATTSDSSEATDNTIDYKSYIGTWYSKDISNSADIYQTGGGSEVRIFSIDDKTAEIMVSTIQSAPTLRTATTDRIYGYIEGNIINFTFQNDSWGSSGYGTLTLLDDTIYSDIVYTNKDSNAMWFLDGSDLFYKVHSDREELLNGNIEGYIGEYSDISPYLGEETEKYYIQDIDNAEIHTYGELILSIYNFGTEIHVAEVDYNNAADKSKYNFQGKVNGESKYIDGNSTYEDVISAYGQPEYEYEEIGEKRIYYYFNHDSMRWYVEFGFNQESQVIRIICSSDTTN